MRVAALAHALDRTGPPVALLTALERVADRRGDEVVLTTVALRAGPLAPRFGRLGDVRVVGEPPMVGDPLRIDPGPERLRRQRGLAALADLADVDVVLVNTAWSVHALHCVPPGRWRCVAWVHELGQGLEAVLAPDDLRTLFDAAALVAVGDDAVADHLVATHDVRPDRLRRVPYGVPLDAPLVIRGPEEELVTALAIPTWRKGPDLLVRVAALLHRIRPRATVTWFGATPGHPDLDGVLADRTRFGLQQVMALRPPVADLDAALAGTAVLVLPSREDAFPLVVLEAGARGVPVVCFDHVGVADLVEGGGATVPFPDVGAFAAAIAELLADPEAARRAGERLRDRVRTAHGADAMAEGLAAVLDEASGWMAP